MRAASARFPLATASHFHYANRALGITGGHTDQQYLPVGITCVRRCKLEACLRPRRYAMAFCWETSRH